VAVHSAILARGLILDIILCRCDQGNQKKGNKANDKAERFFAGHGVSSSCIYLTTVFQVYCHIGEAIQYGIITKFVSVNYWDIPDQCYLIPSIFK